MYIIKSVIILVINKSDSRCAVVRFCYHSYDYRPNNILEKITRIAINHKITISEKKKNSEVMKKGENSH